MTIRLALCCGALILGVAAASAADQPIPMTTEQLGKRTDQLHAVFDQAAANCAKDGRVPLVTRVTPEGWPQFACVGADDPKYQGQQSMTDMNIRLRPLVGQYIQHAVELLGEVQPTLRHPVDLLGKAHPDLGDESVYTWGHLTEYLQHLPPSVGDMIAVDGLLPGCRIVLTVDPATQIIKNYEYTEQRGGCWPYAQKLDEASALNGH